MDLGRLRAGLDILLKMLPMLAAMVLFTPPIVSPIMAPAIRKDAAGWIFAHLEGKPYDIGFQYGSLMAKEIDDAHKAVRSEVRGPKGEGWDWYRDAAKKLFWSKVDDEYKSEIDGQVDGLKAKGYSYDRWDVLAFNGHIELEGYYIPWLRAQDAKTKLVSGAKESCSAFVATGSATKDGNVVIGHNLWWGYLMGQRANLMLDIKPAKGNRVMFDAFCGMLHSGTDFAMNSAGLVLCETTISGFAGFDPNGVPEFVRMRKAIQYSSSLAEMESIFRKGNNGGYANAWLMGDIKTKEIGKLELGLKHVTFVTTKDGYYVGANFPEDPKLIRDEVPGGWNKDPKFNGSERRRVRWCSLLDANKGAVDVEKGKEFLGDTFDEVLGKKGASGSTLNGKGEGGGAVNAKVADSTMVRNFQVWARMGFSDGSAMKFGARQNPLLRDIPSQPWLILDAKTLK